jgi:large subunit ribosomal protein L21
MYAIIEEGGRQYKVTGGDTILIDREAPTGEGEKSITFDRVLLVAGEGTPKVGLPTVANVIVTADVIGEEKGDKIDIQKYKRRKGYHKKIGHRQRYLRVKITDIKA